MQNKNPTLNDILKTFSNEEIIDRIIEIYPNEKQNKKGYRYVLDILRQMKKKATGMIIVVEKVEDEDETYTTVSGKKNTTKLSYALEYTLWREWLGMRIDKTSLHHYNYLDIIAYCLWEMTWRGFNEDDIQKEFKHLTKVAKEIKKSKKNNYKSQLVV